MKRFKDSTKIWPTFKLPFLLAVMYFIIGFATLSDYGINWDEPIHWYRGQAYLRLYLTGKDTYEGLPKIAEHQRAREGVDYLKEGYVSVKDFRRSYYQDNSLTAKYFLKEDAGHPPLNGILASLTNYVFYQKMGILGDIQSHHLFNLLSSSLLVFIVAHFALISISKLASVFAALTLTTYPLFFAESHFNVKDPVETAFFAATIWAYWLALERKKWKWLFVSGIFGGLALGTKFNAFFLVPILLIYTLLKFRKNLRKIPIKYFVGVTAATVLAALIFYASWPYLWSDPIGNFIKIAEYYKQIGTGTFYNSEYLIGGFNIFTLFWIAVTSPVVMLVLCLIGIYISVKAKNDTYLLWVIWLAIPIARASLPHITIYGGVRQLMEFLPAMVLLTALGMSHLIQKYKFHYGLALLLLVPQIISIVIWHPNQNVYFNFLVGGLKGAQEKNIPYWGNSFGNAYWQAITWLNNNSEPNAKLGLIQGTGLNIPQMQLRPDIQYWNSYWSGMERNGEYLLELTHNEPVVVYQYAWDYVNKFLEPVYEVKVDDVAIAKIWKNDLAHTKPAYKNDHKIISKIQVAVKKELKSLEVNLYEPRLITRFQVDYANKNCLPSSGKVYTSNDGTNWIEEKEPIPFSQISGNLSVSEKQTNHFFAAKEVKFLRFIANDSNQCILNNPKVSVYSIN